MVLNIKVFWGRLIKESFWRYKGEVIADDIQMVVHLIFLWNQFYLISYNMNKLIMSWYKIGYIENVYKIKKVKYMIEKYFRWIFQCLCFFLDFFTSWFSLFPKQPWHDILLIALSRKFLSFFLSCLATSSASIDFEEGLLFSAGQEFDSSLSYFTKSK